MMGSSGMHMFLLFIFIFIFFFYENFELSSSILKAAMFLYDQLYNIFFASD